MLLEEEFIQNQERLKPQEVKAAEERIKVDELRGTPMNVGSLDEIVDDNHAIVSTPNGPECVETDSPEVPFTCARKPGGAHRAPLCTGRGLTAPRPHIH